MFSLPCPSIEEAFYFFTEYIFNLYQLVPNDMQTVVATMTKDLSAPTMDLLT
jgi:hypothetical protein